MGFLFAIPRTEKFRFRADADHGANSYYYSDNTNFEEISDWLTKIIVGLTLVKFQTILEWMNNAAKNMSRTMLSDPKCEDPCLQFYVFSYAVIVLYILVGGSMTYLWPRINFARMLTANRKYLEKLETMKHDQQAAGLKTLNPQLIDNLFQTEMIRGQVPGTGSNQPQISNAFKATVEKEYQTRPIKDKTDLQKDRWGGKAEKKDCWLSASVESDINTGFYRLLIKVSPLTTEKNIGNQIAFFLHDTFPKEIVYVNSNAAGEAILMLNAYEAFTVGAYLEDGTDLELDLNNVPGYPKGFYWGKK